MRPLSVCALLAEHKEIVDVIRHPLGVESDICGRHGGRGKLISACTRFVRIPAAEGVAKAGRGVVQPVKVIAIAIGHSAFLIIAI